MSLILEALRKSEAERRRGQSPNLHAELPPVARTQRQPIPLWLWLVVGLTALAIVLWWVRSAPQPASPAAIATTASGTASSDITHAVVTDAEPPRPNPPASHPPIRTVEPARKPTPDAAGAAPPAARPSPAPAAEPDLAAVAPPPMAAPEPLPEPPSTGPIASDDDVLRLTDLSAEQRKQLPPLKMSMHMWNDAPAQRFVIIDGNRYAEGDRIGDAVVETIVIDGVLLNWNGLRLKLSMR